MFIILNYFFPIKSSFKNTNETQCANKYTKMCKISTQSNYKNEYSHPMSCSFLDYNLKV